MPVEASRGGLKSHPCTFWKHHLCPLPCAELFLILDFWFWFYWLRCCASSHCSTPACSSWQELSGGTNLLTVVPFTASILSSGFFQRSSSNSFRSFHRSYTSWNLSRPIVNVLTWDKPQSLKWWIFSSHYPVFWFLRFSFSISVAFPTL